jgi:hypothetical protein
MKLNSVICYWSVDSNNDWNLVKSYGVDCDGYSLEPRVEGEKGDGEQPWHRWLKNLVDGEIEPIMGRAVTSWSMAGGINLVGYNPAERVSWLADDFYKKIKDNELWIEVLKDGSVLYFRTLNEASKYIKEAKCYE